MISELITEEMVSFVKDHPGMGRVLFAKEFGLTEYQARKILLEIKTGREISKEMKELKKLAEMGLSINELKKFHKKLRQPQQERYKTHKIKVDPNVRKVKIGAFSDAHIGHKNYRADILEYAAHTFEKENVDMILNAGDTLEGTHTIRQGHIWELSEIGWSNQRERMVREFEKFHIPVQSIEASNSHTGWYHTHGNLGVDAGKELDDASDNYEFLGWDEADIVFNNLVIRLRHPGGGTAYALSYKGQKYLNSISGGQKPHIVLTGHFHKALYMFYRNVHYFDLGTLQDQSDFMRKVGTPAHLGFWVISIEFTNTGWIQKIIPTLYPFYEEAYNGGSL